MLAALSACAAHLEQFGGHRAAAGLTTGAGRGSRRSATRWRGGPTTGSGPTTFGPGCGSTASSGSARSRRASTDGIEPPGAVRRREPEAGVLDSRRQPGRRPAANQGAASQHEPAAGRRRAARACSGARPSAPPRCSAARRPRRGLLDRAEYVQRLHVARMSLLPTSGRRARSLDEVAAAAPTRHRRLRRRGSSSCSTWPSARRGPRSGPPAGGRMTREDPESTAQSTSGETAEPGPRRRELPSRVRHAAHLPGRPPEAGKARACRSRTAGGRNFTSRPVKRTSAPARIASQMRGAVQLESSDGLVAKTEAAIYSQSEGIVRAPGPAVLREGTAVRLVGGHDVRQGPRPDLDCSTARRCRSRPDAPETGAGHITRARHTSPAPITTSGTSAASRCVRRAHAVERARDGLPDRRRLARRDAGDAGHVAHHRRGRRRGRAARHGGRRHQPRVRGRRPNARRRDAVEPAPRAGEHRPGRPRRGAARRGPVDRRAVRDGRGDGRRP